MPQAVEYEAWEYRDAAPVVLRISSVIALLTGKQPLILAGHLQLMSPAIRQLRYLAADADRIVNGKRWRWFSIAFSHGFQAVALYRLDRMLYLAFGKMWRVMRTLLAPVFFLLRPWIHGCEIHYGADIGPGLLLLHPSLGVLVSSHAVMGSDCTLTGGNCIGVRDGARTGTMEIGHHVVLGVNSVVLGPIRVGSRVTVGANSVALHDVPDGAVVGGVPARELPTSATRRAAMAGD
jgi:serine acetyltransferase